MRCTEAARAHADRVFFWFGEHYDLSLLFQALLMIAVQTLLLHVALLHRPGNAMAQELSKPFSTVEDNVFAYRPYNFWRWRLSRSYWQFLSYFALCLASLQLLVGDWKLYVKTIGYVALAIEATLPLPQMVSNQRCKSCKGFRLSVLANWILGDAMKMCFFFMSETDIPWAFKLCGMFQAACDLYLGVQYWQFGEGQGHHPATLDEIGMGRFP